MKFIVDAQLPPALAGALRETGLDVQAVRELGLREAEDSDIWELPILAVPLPAVPSSPRNRRLS